MVRTVISGCNARRLRVKALVEGECRKRRGGRRVEVAAAGAAGVRQKSLGLDKEVRRSLRRSMAEVVGRDGMAQQSFPSLVGWWAC